MNIQPTQTPAFIATKFRELSSDKIIYTLPGHSIEKPITLTIQSDLPVPRKGNPGTVKTFVNIRRTVVLDSGLATERNVPTIVKLETSFPVGTTQADRLAILAQIASVASQSDEAADNLFYDGLLPND
jgi:hypothetical protein